MMNTDASVLTVKITCR